MYGTCRYGGIASIPSIEGSKPGYGTIFKVNPAGQLTTLHVFNPYLGFGETSPQAGLLRGMDGLFYGSAQGSTAADSFGAAFSISRKGDYAPRGVFFNSGTPVDKFMQTSLDGQIYGVYPSGANGLANFYGSLFKIPYSILSGEALFFTEESGGPRTVISGDDAKLYITTSNRIYSYRALDGLTLIHDFGPAVSAVHRLLIASDGNIYGTTSGGGNFGLGEVFRISLKKQTLTAATPRPATSANSALKKSFNSPPSIRKTQCRLSRKNKSKVTNCNAKILDAR